MLESRVVIGGDMSHLHVFDLTTPNCAVGSRRPPKALSSIDVGHDVGCLRAGPRYLCAASAIGTCVTVARKSPLFLGGSLAWPLAALTSSAASSWGLVVDVPVDHEGCCGCVKAATRP